MPPSNPLIVHQFDLQQLPHHKTYLLTPYEADKLSRLNTKNRILYQQTRYLLRDLLSVYNIAPTALLYSPEGKPLIESDYSISLSHSQNIWLVGIIKASQLGIDLQISPPKSPDTLIQKCQLPQDTSIEMLMQHWSLAESYYKCTQNPFMSTLKTNILQRLKQEGYDHYYSSNPSFAAVSDNCMTRSF